MRRLRIERMENRELLAADGVGAAVEFVETDTATTVEVTLPTNDVIIREIKKRIANPGGGSEDSRGAEVEFVELDTGTLLQIGLPKGKRLVKEVGKKMSADPGNGGNPRIVTAVVGRDGSASLEDGTTIETTNGEALLKAGQLQVGDDASIVLRGGKPANGTGPVVMGTYSTTGGKK